MNTLFERYLCEYNDKNIFYVADYYGTPGARQLAHMVKQGEEGAINHMAEQMAELVHPNSLLIPMPSSNGTPTYTLALAERISEITNNPVMDVLRGSSHEKMYDLKYKDTSLSSEDFGMYLTSPLPSGTPVIIDNIMDTGDTVDAALSVIPDAMILVHSIVSH